MGITNIWASKQYAIIASWAPTDYSLPCFRPLPAKPAIAMGETKSPQSGDLGTLIMGVANFGMPSLDIKRRPRATNTQSAYTESSLLLGNHSTPHQE